MNVGDKIKTCPDNKKYTTSLEFFINQVFCNIPKDPCTYIIENNVDIVFLTYFMLAGANKLYGSISPQTITLKQFEKLNKCMESVGYSIKYTIENEKYKIWFERYMDKRNCHGITVY